MEPVPAHHDEPRSPARRPVLATGAGAVATALAGTLVAGNAPAHAGTTTENDTGHATHHPPHKTPVATGHGGAVASVDPDATRVGLEVLRRGGNAVDAAIATAAALGVTEAYSCGLGGGGYLVYYDAKQRRVSTLDGRETAPARMRKDSFLDPKTGTPMPFDDAVTSGLSVGTPGTPATWAEALRRWGTHTLSQALAPAAELADHGFVVDDTFRQQTEENAERFAWFPDTAGLYLPHGKPPKVGSRLRNPDLAATYRELGRRGVGWLYHGRLGAEISRAAHKPPTTSGKKVHPGLLTADDLARYRVPHRSPSHVRHTGLDVYGMAGSSSGGLTVGLALNILTHFPLRHAAPERWLHLYLEACRLAYADRNRFSGDPAYERVPLRALLSSSFTASRACAINPAHAATSPVDPGDPTADGPKCGASTPGAAARSHEGPSTTHFVVADRWGNVVSYTFTIEQTGGSAIMVPGRGFLLNNELTDFDFAPPSEDVPDPNLPAGGKRPRSSMAPTLALRDGRPALAVGSPGGPTIITTVLQILLRHLDRGAELSQALAAPRLCQQNTKQTQSEPGFDGTARERALKALGHSFDSSAGEIGAAAGLEFLGKHRLQAVAEPKRRGGGAAGVLTPRS